MTVICRPPTKTGTSRYISDFVREAIPEPIGDPKWYGSFAGATQTNAPVAEAPNALIRKTRESIRRRLPSLAFHAGMSAGDLFAERSGRQAAQQKGIDLHAQFEAVEWIDPAAPKDDIERQILANGWTEAFVKGADVVALWRERSYERLVGTEWESGQFDRVVFRGEGDARRATIYDFKTNALRRGETNEIFAERMRTTYAGQMAAYRSAVASLADLPPSRVEAVLLLVVTGEAVRC